ncbi:MAG TPA: NUDIX domain-containing protein [Candidatus Dormibacteraeota bacterium]
MSKESAGLLLYRDRDGRREVLLIHPGGPFWAKRDTGSWSLPKGEIEPGETAMEVALREFREELGQDPPRGISFALGTIRQAGGKLVHAWAVQGDLDVERIESVTFEMEWPPRSGRKQEFPEVDRAAWFKLEEARTKILPGQAVLIDRLERAAAAEPPPPDESD